MADLCRKCSDCDGQHHWVEYGYDAGVSEPHYVCKHCEATAAMCEGEHCFDGVAFPIVGDTHLCDECRDAEYTEDC